MPGRLPSQIAWRHVGGREGFEAAFVAEVNGGLCFTGTTAALEEGHVWTVRYQVIVDLESSVLTNALPVRRLGLACGQGADAPGAYVRAEDLRVERLEQRYVRLEDQDTGRRFAYAAPAFDFTCVLAYDDAGLLLDYPGIAVRAT